VDPDPDSDPDPAVFSSLTLLKEHLHQFSKIKSQKEVAKQQESKKGGLYFEGSHAAK
jgi:hypothetical protein